VIYVVNDQVVLSRVPEGPLVAYLVPFADSLSQQRYTQHYLHRQVMLAACFSRWLKKTRVPLHSITSAHVGRYLRCRNRRRRPRRGDPAALGHFIEFLRREGVLAGESMSASPPTPSEQCVRTYEPYLREERALAEATIVNYVPFVTRFLEDRFGSKPFKLSRLRARDVVGFVQQEASQLSQNNTAVLAPRTLPTGGPANELPQRPLALEKLCRVPGHCTHDAHCLFSANSTSRCMSPYIVRDAR
jgi:integrase/recombinase XerD